ncbi:hypothetical protein WMF18_09605 [Sorangium sp. So ce315]|uniref:hypothetical protein n=1 Tax=Sorangium sp. So ce315 TaxID=3133299 RepID=UPI003F5EFE78
MDRTRFLVRPRPRGRRLFPRLCAAALAAAALAGSAGQAGAAVSISREVERTGDRRDDANFPLWISRKDCLEENDLAFTLTLRDFSTNDTLSIWASGTLDCTQYSNRDTGTRCKEVLSVSNLDDTMDIRVPVRKIAEALGAEGCNSAAASTGALPLVIYFMRLRSPDEDATDVAKWDQTKVDLQGPLPPGDIEARSGDGRLLVAFRQNEDEDVQGYYFYCDDAGQSSVDAAGAGGGGQGTAGGAGDPACSSAKLVPGQVPDGLDPCGDVGKADQGSAGGLTNGKRYVVGVAAYDGVGNAGPLSALACGTPVAVDGFFEKYREAGGQAGGGFCSVGGPVGAGRWVSWPLGALAAGAALGWWRRGRRRGARSVTQESE